MSRALYRKYRSKSLAEVVGQEHITDTLSRAVSSGRISHAYLFTGPRGVGKTSIARILAHEVNGLEYSADGFNIDIIEIDAASNRRIDEIRDLRDKVHIAPASSKYKVYIIDEVHMLTREAFNALLKTLEEPPDHSIFILATTEAHKLPETIISRTQRFSFKPITPPVITSHLRYISQQEHITAADDALTLISQHADGSVRDAISMLDQLGSSGRPVTAVEVLQLLGIPPATAIRKLMDSVRCGNSQAIIDDLQQLKDQGFGAPMIAQQLSREIRSLRLSGQPEAWQTILLRGLLDVPLSPQPAQLLEIILLEHSLGTADEIRTPPAEVAGTAAKPEKTRSPQRNPDAEAPKPRTAEIKPEPLAAPPDGQFDMQNWQQVLDAVKLRAASLYTALRLAEPRLESGKMTLAFQFPLHQKKLNQPENKKLLSSIIDGFGNVSAIDCVVDKKAGRQLPATALEVPSEILNPLVTVSETLETISNIFGGAEVLES